MTYNYNDKYRLQQLVGAHHTIENASITKAEAVAALEEIDQYERWVRAELRWKDQIKSWLNAESRWRLEQLKFEDETYAAAKRGWNTVRQYVPRLDGVNSFDELPESQQFRWAAFAAAILDLVPPPEVKSQKQRTREAKGE